MMSYSVLDLFCGAGGFSLGLHWAGLRTVAAIEIDRFALSTYNYNFPKINLYSQDIRKFTDSEIINNFKGIDILVAGPPCQGFSVAGPSQYGKIDKRNNLLLQTIRFVKLLKPAVVVIENVKGILSGKLPSKQQAIKVLQNELNCIGYNSTIQVLQAADFGVPQWRERVFILATRNQSLKINPNGTFGTKSNPWRTVGQSIFDLPIIYSGEGVEHCIPYDRQAESTFQIFMRNGSKGVTNHVAMKHTPRLRERFKYIEIGKSLVHVPAEHGQRKRNSKEIDVRKRFKMNNQRLDPNKVSLAITASFQSNFVHPELHRNLTAREGARLQSFPDHFILKGPRTLMSRSLLEREGREDEIGLSQYNQIGNAVPPLLAEGIASAIKKALMG